MKQKRTAEDYLKTIHILSRHGEVRGTHIADVLGVSRATVSLTLKALEQEGYLLRMADHTVRLTDAGREIAEATYARNRFSARCSPRSAWMRRPRRMTPARWSMRSARKALPRCSGCCRETNTKEKRINEV